MLTAQPNQYHLDIDLPFTVDANETGAQFDKETQVRVTGHFMVS